MILDLDHYHTGYSQILNDCRKYAHGGKALILCHTDVDAMAAARIWTYMLRQDSIDHQLLPCNSFPQLHNIFQQYVTESVQAIILINLGATRNLVRLLSTTLLPKYQSKGRQSDLTSKVYVMDGRRPVHLANIHAGENIVVFWDNDNELEDVPSDGDNLSGNDSASSSEDDGSGSDSEDESGSDDESDEGEYEFGGKTGKNDDDDAAAASDRHSPSMDADDQDTDYDAEDEQDGSTMTRSKRQRLDVNNSTGDDIDLLSVDESNEARKDVDDDDVDDTMPRRSKQSLGKATMSTDDASDTNDATATKTPQQHYQDRQDRLRMYYNNGSYYGLPAAYMAHRLASQLRFGQIGDLLWLACVGVTDSYLQARVDVSGYAALAIDLRSACQRLFPNDVLSRTGRAVYAENLITNPSNNASQDDSSVVGGSSLTKISFSENGRILSESDFRFFLLRHSSLLDAMVFSDFISTKFQLTTRLGMQRLKELLATMGFALEQCRQPFAFMKPQLRRRLQDQLREHAEDFGLEHFEFTSFFRVTGYQSLLSASDTAYAVSALLERDTKTKTRDYNTTIAEEDEQIYAFNQAYDALLANALPSVSLHGINDSRQAIINGSSLTGSGLPAGIRLAMDLQRSIMATAASLIQRNAITRLSHFRYAYVTCTSQAEHVNTDDQLIQVPTSNLESQQQHHVFSKPLALTRLAHYLMDMHRENGKWTGPKARPLVLVSEKPQTQTFVVAGFEYPEIAGNFTKNRFGKNFELAAQSMKGTFRFDSFDSHVVEVAASDVQRFIEQLHYLLESL